MQNEAYGGYGSNIFCKGSVDTTILGVDTMVQNKGRNVKKSPSQVDTSPEQCVDTPQGQVNTLRNLCDLNSLLDMWHPREMCNKPGHMKGECPENKKEKHKKIHKFKKPKAMVATWSDEDSSEEEEEEKSSSSDSEEICFMANSSDGKVSTSFEDFSVEDWQDAYAELVEKYSEMRKENKHIKKKVENILHNQNFNKRICELENEVIELNKEKENLLNLIDELKLASQKATNEFKDLSEKLEKENQDKQQKIEEIKILENQLRQKDEVIETFTNGKDNLEALLGTNMKSISHGLGFDKQKSKKDKSGEKKDKAPLIKFVKVPSLENSEIKQKSSKTQKGSKTQNKNKTIRSTQSPYRSTPVHKKKASVAVVSTPVQDRSTCSTSTKTNHKMKNSNKNLKNKKKSKSTLLHLVSTHFDSGRHSPPLVSTLTPCQTQFQPWAPVKRVFFLRGRLDGRHSSDFRQAI
ncbi:hypothetical protein Taro_035403 [Colocasia esculenta]|uniref:Uncharacterized protein n=1 Tax=Colocasia esculenta TaxID=4460 RepID=A0A843WES9_COLES|nr:hypothetical protein [Colocasia esculenta]